MFETLLVSRLAGALAAHSAARQSVIAQNVANADTPDYKARDIAPFAQILEQGGLDMAATRPGHLTASFASPDAELTRRGGEPSPNGNTVGIEDEMIAAAEVRQSQDMAIGIYRSVSAILRGSLERGA